MRIISVLVSFSFFLVTLKFVTNASSSEPTLHCYYGSFENYSVFSLDNPVPLLDCSCYDPERRTVFYTFGFNGEVAGPSAEAIVKAYLRLPFNIILVNWENQASGGVLGNYLGYLTAVHNTIIVGKHFGRALVKLIEAGLNRLKTHLIGFSLGASLMGYAAREVQESGQNISRVTGLDPARPLFDGHFSLRGLDASSANFVMIIHTNPGVLGSVESGTVDVWPNCDTFIQPGCAEAASDCVGILSPESALFKIKQEVLQHKCSHDRSWMYLVEALKRPNSFIARRGDNCNSWSTDGDTFSIEDEIPLSTHGNFYLSTNPTPFYGKGKAGSIPDAEMSK